ncbi:acetylornithine transaminase [Streptomyces sp. NBC_00859]|uniref:acetylornithine transaminase n=1 Tax=Streptomyces sp. NBC_00859 TaxID=2903682 RepID=UPI00386565B1|nr:acetylornithine transaminase [Streptomyces sp. NBC_00859]
MSENASLTTRWQNAMMANYGTPRAALVRGAGTAFWDVDGNRYLDFLGGIAVNVLGSAHPAIVRAVTEQLNQLGHVSNLFIAEPPVRLAENLLGLAGRQGRVFLCNSGTEANEAALKIARLTGRPQVISADGSFHGRTLGALAMTGQAAKRQPFEPLPGGVLHVPYGDVDALATAVTDRTAMLILEPIQGEGGIIVPPPGYLAAARDITRRTGTLLAFDEVQTGTGRTGHWFAHQSEGVEPDVITLGKALGGGLPLAAVLAFDEAAGLFAPGTHGSTFGGNPVACAAALAVLETIEDQNLLQAAVRQGDRLVKGIGELRHPLVDHVRGSGLLQGIVLTQPHAKHVEELLESSGFLVNAVAADVIRLAPPLIIADADVDDFLHALPAALNKAMAAQEQPA